MARYIFRLDDIAPNMRWENYLRVKDLFDKYDVKPVVGVIPDNRSAELRSYARCPFDFWEHIRILQKSGWEIALHGYQHRLSPGGGLLGVNPRGEFAGLSYEIQLSKLNTAFEIFKRQRIQVRTFMAPAHSYDRETLRALKELEIVQITDGLALFPYRRNGILFVPQIFALPRKMPFGVFTFCLHTNTMDESIYKRTRDFVSLHRCDVISFQEAAEYSSRGIMQVPVGLLLKQVSAMIRIVRKMKA